MVSSSLSQMMNLCQYESHAASTNESMAEKSRMFAEESTFFLSLFKNRPIKPIPDPGLMIVLQRDKRRRKKRKISKKEKPEKLYFSRKQQEESPPEGDKSKTVI